MNVTQAPVQHKEPVLFEYTGRTALTVTGSVTKRIYRFSFPGNVVSVDFSDAAAMMAVPVLRKITKS